MSARVPIVKVLTNLALGGTEKQVVRLAASLDRERFDLRFACFRHWGELVAEVEDLGIPVSEYKLRSLARPGTLRQQVRFAAMLGRERIRVVHAYNFYANVFAVPAARLAGVPCVVASVRDTGVYLDSVKQRLQRLACRFAHRIVVNADAVRSWLVGQDIDPERISVIPNGLDVSRYAVPRGGHGFRDAIRVPRTAPLVVMLARVNRQKGIDYFVDAAASVLKRVPDAHFVVVGGNFGGDEPEVAYRREVEARAERLGIGTRLHFTGFRDDVPEILAEADLSVLPSLSEGLSNTLLESMAAGLPVVATRVGGTPEVISDGINGLLVAPHDANGLAAAMTAALCRPSLAQALGERARRHVAERYSFERMARDTEALYDQQLNSRCISIARYP